MAAEPGLAPFIGSLDLNALDRLESQAHFNSGLSDPDFLGADESFSPSIGAPVSVPFEFESPSTSPMEAVTSYSRRHRAIAGHRSHPSKTRDLSYRQSATASLPSPPAAKRQKRSAPPVDSSRSFHDMYNIWDAGRRHSIDSQCCSSCSEGDPCAEPDCGIQKEALIPCMEPKCNQPVCPSPCLDMSSQGGQAALHHGVIPSSARLPNWEYSSWNPPGQQSSHVRSFALLEESDTELMEQVRALQNRSRSVSTPTTPSMANNMETPFSPAGAAPTPQSEKKSLPLTPTNLGSIVSGAGMLFPPTGPQWDQQMFGHSNLGPDSSMFNCAWTGCAQPFPSLEEWTEHIHRAHVDPQMTFDCPLPTNNCPQNISHNPIHHLEADHGFSFLMDNQYTCPAPDCDPDQTFLSPMMLHNHFDQAHAIPAAGALFCKWNSCDAAFPDPHELFAHLNEHHQLTNLLSTDSNDHTTDSKPMKDPTAIPDAELPEDDTKNRCRWKTGNGSVCGAVCQTESDLQNHVKEAHLMSLNNRVGYNCQWEDCCRPARLGDKAGFTARGKLERHMATHTGYKMSRCDICNEVFSAPQSMKQHRRLHTGEKPWVCKYCGKTFPQQSACTIHERIHTNEKPLQCPYPGCGARFSDSSNLAKHRKTHGEEGVHACRFPGCGKSFHRLDQLKRHRSVHQNASESQTSLESLKVEVDGGDISLSVPESLSQ